MQQKAKLKSQKGRPKICIYSSSYLLAKTIYIANFNYLSIFPQKGKNLFKYFNRRVLNFSFKQYLKIMETITSAQIDFNILNRNRRCCRVI